MLMKVHKGSHSPHRLFSPHGESLIFLRFKVHTFLHPDTFSLFDDDFPADGMNELEPISTLSPDPQENDGTTPTEAAGMFLTKFLRCILFLPYII